jgi:GAF domain-containing protein
VSDPSPAANLAACRRPPTAERLRALLADAARALGAAEATLWVFDDDSGAMAAAINHGPAAAVVEAQTVPTGESVVGFVATQGVPMVIGPSDWQNPTVIRATGTAVTAMVVVPVWMDGEVVGALSLINPERRERFAPEDLAAAARWAGRAAEALGARGPASA